MPMPLVRTELLTKTFGALTAVNAVTLEVAPGIDEIESDELRVKQVLVNLLSNAVKFTPDGGHVAVAARRVDDELEVTVTDDGAGIAPEDRERIFESFQQGRRGPQREEGTGLGLTLCRRIVSLLGGRMWLQTEVGVGSSFGFSLPVGRPTEPPGGEDVSTAGEIVVIEDDRPSLDLMTAYLAGAALRVTAARDGQTGLDAVRRVRPDAVLLDIRLPGIDGWAVLQTLKSDEETRAIPVIVVSSRDRP